MAVRKQINVGPVVYEEYESEIIAINLDSGAYYSLVGASAVLWKLVRSGASTEQLASHFAAAHGTDPASISAEVEGFLRRLEAEQLVVDLANAETSVVPLMHPPSAEKTPFPGFEMNIYTDMQDLLLLDPVHDVGDTGWPAEMPKTAR